MRLEQFFEKFELFADAPNAVGKLRELVLELAVQGKLVQQDPSEEPVRELLKHIELARSDSANSAKGKRRELLPPIEPDNSPYALPQGWAWCRLGTLGIIGSSCRVHQKDWTTSGVPFLRAREIVKLSKWGQVENNLFITEEHFQRLAKEGLTPDPNDIMITGVGTIGVPYVVRDADRFYFKDASVLIFKNRFGLYPNYLHTVMQSPYWVSEIHRESMGTTVHTLTIVRANSTPIPLPPAAEQKRIVAKVDELMTLCDRLEVQQQERDTRHAALARASLTRFAEAPTPANLDFLFHPSYAITPADLRKAILSLAVQGQLIPQNIDDEFASVTLNDAGVDLKRWAVAQEDQRFESPESWTWIRFAGVGDQRLGKMLDAHKNRGELKPYLRNTNVQWMRFELDDVKEMRVEKTEEDVLRLRKGDLLICEGGEPGRCAIWNEEVSDMYFQKALHRVRPCEAILAEYLALNLQVDCQNDVLAGYFTGATIKHFTGRSLSQYPVPIPPLAEQHRIVAKVDHLMAMVDQLEVQLAEAKTKSTALLDAVIHELLNPSAEIVDLAAYRAAMACYAIRKMATKPYFGRTAAMKLFYLAQAHVGLELDLKPLRDAAGPLDQWIYDFEKEGAREDWFRVSEGNIANGKKKITYQPGRMIAEQSALAERLLSASQRKEYDRLLALFADRTTEEAEIIATLFAAWNDFLIDGHSPSDDQIVTEVREHWHERKGRFTPTVLRQWLAWLRQNNLVPTGHLPHTVHQPQLLLH